MQRIGLNLGIGLAIIPLAIWIARRYGERLGRSRILEHLADDIAGLSLTTAMGHLERDRAVRGSDLMGELTAAGTLLAPPSAFMNRRFFARIPGVSRVP
jgi:hypothetical protein